MKQRRILSLLLVFALLAGFLPGITLGVSAAGEDHAITVLSSAPAAAEVAQGAQYKLYMDEVFEDSEGHDMTYTLAGQPNETTKLASDDKGTYLSFACPDTDTYTLTLTAACASGASASHDVEITVTEAEAGDKDQYDYDETPADSVKVYFTLSSDGVPLVDIDGNVLAHMEVELPYFDLEKQGLDEFYRYETEGGEGSYINDTLVQRPTALHLYLYMLGVHYLGFAPEDVTEGGVVITEQEARKEDVYNMDNEVAYAGDLSPLALSGSPCSLFMNEFWGHDLNLMYYRNHVYPLQSGGWGSTVDYILLSDGDTIDVGLFTNYSFWGSGAFAKFDQDDYTVKQGESLTVQTLKYDTAAVADGGTEQFDPISSEELNLALYKRNSDGQISAGQEAESAEILPVEDSENGNEFRIDTSSLKPGEYCLIARDVKTGEDANYAPATAIITVEAGDTPACTHTETETAFKAHSPADGSFDEITTCKACGEQVGEASVHLYGDVNGDGAVTAADAEMIRAYVSAQAAALALNSADAVTEAWQIYAADVDGDGAVTAVDAAVVDAVASGSVAAASLPAETTTSYEPAGTGESGPQHKVIVKLGDVQISETTEACTDDGENKCSLCGADLSVAVPTRKEGYPEATSAAVKTGMAYLLSDLQSGKIFQAAEGQSLRYTNYYYERSADGGQTWGPKTGFSDAIFGATTIQITETQEGTYMYRFYASHDGEHFSTDTWTLTLHVSDQPVMNFSFYVGKDYTGGYPIIKLYNVETDSEGNETLGEELTGAFCYSDFTATLPEGTAEYDPAQGLLANNYQMFYAALPAGRYMYRAFAKDAETGEYSIALGGMTLDLPTDTNVDGGTGGGTKIYLQCNSFYANSKKADNTYFTAEEYHVRLDCPLMKCSAEMGDPYVKNGYTYYPTMLYAAGNACLYNLYFYPDIDGYIFSQNINQTYTANYSANTKYGTISAAMMLEVTVPEDAVFGLYFQWNNFNTTEVAPDGAEDVDYADRWTDNGDGTKTAAYYVSKSSGNYTWRLSDDTHVTKSGWLPSISTDLDVAFTFESGAPTDRLSHDFSKLGTQAIKRDEADLQINLDPSGFKTLSGTTRVRAYRHWQIIDSDAGNIMVEPDYEWDTISELGGDAQIETVNGGNAVNNWADITPGTDDSFIFVRYNSMDTYKATVRNGNMTLAYASHGGFYPATSPERVGVIVVGGTGTAHGSADADVDFNMAEGATTTRSMDWDYNYDTWYYNDDDPEMTFTVKNANGNADVSFAMVGFDAELNPEVQMWESAPVDEGGVYHLPIDEIFDKLGNGRGGTVIIRMEDSDGVSYRLVRASKVDITAENVSHTGEPIMPGDQVKLSFKGMYRSVNKVSGIFNPTVFKPTYYDQNGTKFESSLAQYLKMDSATVTVTVPEDMTFAEGEETKTYTFTNGYTFGSMYSAANPFVFLYTMTDTGVGTNFNAVTVSYYMHHYADAAVTVNRKVLYNVKLHITDENGAALENVTVTMTDANGKVYTANEDGTFSLGYGTYSYDLTKEGYARSIGKFSLSSADAEKVADGVLNIDTTSLPTAGENAWDGTIAAEPKQDDSGVYLIGTGAELAWFAKTVNGGQKSISAKLTADIELTGKAWTPIGSNTVKYGGTFDGDGHVIQHLYINSEALYQGLFGYLSGSAKISKLGVTGIVTTTKNFAAGIAGFMENSAVIDCCFSTVQVTAAMAASGIANGQSRYATITNCYNTGDITATGTSGLAAGISSGNDVGYAAAAANCYSIGAITAVKNIGGIVPGNNDMLSNVTNSYYLNTTVQTATRGEAKTADELKALAETLGEAFTADTANINGGYPILTWQASETPPAALLGDVNGDGEVDFLDAGMIYAYYNGTTDFTDEQVHCADVDGSGEIDFLDAGMVYAYYNGTLESFPAEES